MPQMRLDKFFSSQNIATRKEIKSLLKLGLISVNDNTKLKPEQKIDTDKDIIKLNGEVINYKKYIYLMLNKPKGVVSATNDNKHKTVLDLVPDNLYRPNLFPAGRLDKDTTGFVLLTDDGDFAHKILAPKSHIEKTYHTLLDGKITQEQIQMFENGIVLEDGYECLPAKIRVIKDGENQLVEIVICEGKYHQIKRMAVAIGRRVLELKRVKMGNLELYDDLQEGECIEILHKDLCKII